MYLSTKNLNHALEIKINIINKNKSKIINKILVVHSSYA